MFGMLCVALAKDDPYKSVVEPDLLSEGVLVTLANGPASKLISFPEPLDSASLSSPATKLWNLFQTEPETFSMLGLAIHEELSVGVCLRRRDSSSSTSKN